MKATQTFGGFIFNKCKMEWIKINSKEDLPAVAGRYQVKNKEDSKVETWYFHHSPNIINFWLTYFSEWRNITHYNNDKT